MTTASIVTYHNSIGEIDTVLQCALDSDIDRIYIVDNTPNDALRILQNYSPKIRYIHNANIGYGGAHNIAILEAIHIGSKYHVVINPDIEFSPEIIGAIAKYMDADSSIGLVMPRVFYPDGRIQYLCKLLPTPADLVIRRFIPKNMFTSARNRFEMRDSGYDREMNVPFLSGCFMFMRIEALQNVGLFDERYFMYGEDIDLSRRIHTRYKTMYYPRVSIIHAHQQASHKSFRMLFVLLCNIIRYFNKWGWFFDNDRRRINAIARKQSVSGQKRA